MTAALLFLRRIPSGVWVALAALAALWAWGHHREGQGYDRAMREATEAAALATAAMQADWEAAQTRDNARQTRRNRDFAPLTKEAADAPADPLCLDDAGRSLLAKAIDLANNPTSAAKGGRGLP